MKFNAEELRSLGVNTVCPWLSGEGLWMEMADHACEERVYDKGEEIVAIGDREEDMRLVVEGSVRYRIFSSEGRVKTIAILLPSATFAEGPAVGEPKYSIFSVEALEKTRLLVFKPETVRKLIMEDEGLLCETMESMGKKIGASVAQIEALVFKDVHRRLAYLLFNYSLAYTSGSLWEKPENEDDHGVVKLTQSALAELAGCSRVSVTVGLRQLQEEGYIYVGRGQIFVRDPEGLLFTAYPRLELPS